MKPYQWALLTLSIGVSYYACRGSADNSKDSEEKKASEEMDRPIQRSQNLQANTENTVRHVTNKNEQQGIADIRKIMQTSMCEESWAYLPEKEQWIEVGRDEKVTRYNGSYRSDTALDMNFITTLIEQNKEVVIYHFHPKVLHPDEQKALDKIVETEAAKMGVDTKILGDIVYDSMYASFAHPYWNDLYALAMITEVQKAVHKEGKVSFKLASLYGVTEFNVTETGKTLSYDDWEQIFPRYQELDAETTFELKVNNDLRGQARAAEFVREMNDDLFRYNFTPYNQ